MTTLTHGLRIIAACGALTLVYSGDSNAGPVRHTIDACDHAVGTDASSIARGATLSMMSRDLDADTFVYEPAVIQSRDWHPEPLTGCGRTVGGSTTAGQEFQSFLDGNSTDWYYYAPFSALRVDFTPRVREVSITGFEAYVDGMYAWLFGPNDQLLDFIIFELARLVFEDDDTVWEYEAWGDVEDDQWDYLSYADWRTTISIPSGMPLAYIVMGSETDVPAWFTSISYSVRVPEPGTLALLGLGLVGMGFARRRKAA